MGLVARTTNAQGFTRCEKPEVLKALREGSLGEKTGLCPRERA